MHKGPKQDYPKSPAQPAAPFRAATTTEAVQRPSRRASLYRSFFAAEEGAVTVDWVVLTAAIVGLGFAVIIPIGYSTESSVIELSGTISDVSTGYTTTAP